MNKERYLSTVSEQVQAYGYKPRDNPASNSVAALYVNKDNHSRGKNWKCVVAVMELNGEGVAEVREASEKAREVVKSQVGVEISIKKIEKILCYLLLIPPSISKQMDIYIEEGHETTDGPTLMRTKSWLYPILVDLENERLVYRKSSGVKNWYLGKVLHGPIEELFQI